MQVAKSKSMKHFGIEVKTSATKEEAKEGCAKGARKALPTMRIRAALCSLSCHSGIQSTGAAKRTKVPMKAIMGQMCLEGVMFWYTNYPPFTCGTWVQKQGSLVYK